MSDNEEFPSVSDLHDGVDMAVEIASGFRRALIHQGWSPEGAESMVIEHFRAGTANAELEAAKLRGWRKFL